MVCTAGVEPIATEISPALTMSTCMHMIINLACMVTVYNIKLKALLIESLWTPVTYGY